MKFISQATERFFRSVRVGPEDRLCIASNSDGTKLHLSMHRNFIEKNQHSTASTHYVCAACSARVRLGSVCECGSLVGGMTEPTPVTFTKRRGSVSVAAKDLLNRIPEKKRVQTGTWTSESFSSDIWEVPLTDFTVQAIDLCWPADQIEWEDEAAETMYNYVLATLNRFEEIAETTAHYKTSGALPSDVDIVESNPDPNLKLSNYQLVAARNSILSEGYDLFMEQGTGKTPIVVARICSCARDLKEDRPYRVLIVAPKNLRLNWINEIEKFRTRPGKAVALRGGTVKRFKSFVTAIATKREEADFVAMVVSYETADRMAELLAVEWDLVVIDEGHAIKNVGTARFKAMIELRDKARSRMLLTGTPITNTAMDLYGQFEFTGQFWSGFSSKYAFKDFHGVYIKKEDGSSVEKLVGIQNIPLLQERLARQAFVITKKEALPDLPDKVYDIVEVDMSPEQAELYESVRKNLVAEIEHDIESAERKGLNSAIVANNILTKLLRLAQITSGFYVATSYDEELAESRTTHAFNKCPKLDALVEILKEKGPNDKTIVWCNFVPGIKMIRKRLAEEGIDAVFFFGQVSDKDREIAVERFNRDPKCKVFVGNPEAGGVGLNLLGYPPGEGDDVETNCNHAIYYAQDWKPTSRWQSEDRCHRRGTREPVRITDLVCPETIDEDIRARVLQKKEAALMITDVRDILARVLGGSIDAD